MHDLDKVRLVIGLGNPDPEYADTYHNVGHQFVNALIARDPHDARKFIKTDAYMNESGACVAQALKKYRLKSDEFLAVQDDSDIAIGEYKFSFGRNAGGHRGIQNIIDHLGTNAFWRLRIGIRPISEKRREKAEHLVLRRISASDRAILDGVFSRVMTAVL